MPKPFAKLGQIQKMLNCCANCASELSVKAMISLYTVLVQIPTTSYQTKILEKHIIRKHMIKQKPENSQSRTESFAKKRAAEINGASMVCGKKQDFNFLS